MSGKTIRVLIFEDSENRQWSAQCLEYDIAAQAKTLPDLFYEFQRTVTGHAIMCRELRVEPFSYLKPAPPRFWQLFDQAKICVARDPVPFGTTSDAISSIAPDFRMPELQLA